ncbi:hypothetical protein [Kitasatospora sp. NPDC057198]|uniref:hypothetical protein n=1 Tax=Kitasatospora sp. NPDC057198 TaxID=3346046 RepID=UPI003645D402
MRRLIAQIINREHYMQIQRAMGLTSTRCVMQELALREARVSCLLCLALRALVNLLHIYRAVSPDGGRAVYERLPVFDLPHHMALFACDLARADSPAHRGAVIS